MKYTIYKTTNLINDKIYIGKHQTTDPDDDYLGSGKHISYAIKKYGRENFVKEVLHIFDNEADMNAKEAELVTLDFIKENTNYNINPGGSEGGWNYANLLPRTELQIQTSINNGKSTKGRKHTVEAKLKMKLTNSLLGNQKGERNSMYGTMWITNGIDNKTISKTLSIPDGWYKGRKIKS